MRARAWALVSERIRHFGASFLIGWGLLGIAYATPALLHWVEGDPTLVDMGVVDSQVSDWIVMIAVLRATSLLILTGAFFYLAQLSRTVLRRVVVFLAFFLGTSAMVSASRLWAFWTDDYAQDLVPYLSSTVFAVIGAIFVPVLVPRIRAVAELVHRQIDQREELARLTDVQDRVIEQLRSSLVTASHDLEELVTQIVAEREERRQSEERYRILADNAEDVVGLFSMDGTAQYVSPSCHTALGWHADEVVGQNAQAFIHPADQAAFGETIERIAMTGRAHLAVRIRAACGAYRWFDVLGHAVVQEGRPAILFIGRDITERKEAEDALREREELFRLLTENSQDMIGLLTLDGVFTYVSPSLRSIGYTPEELLGHSGFDYVHPDDLPMIQALLAVALGGEVVRVVYRARTGDGGWHWFEGHLKLVQRNDTPLILIAAQDVTERKRLEDQVLQVQKMDAVGKLAGGVAHDFNNLLTIIRGYVDLARDSVDALNPVHQDLSNISEAVDRATALTRQLLAFARKQVMEPQVIAANALVESASKMLRRLIPENIELVMLPGHVGNMRVDPGQMDQVLINLVVNARDAMPDGGIIRIATETVDAALLDIADLAPGPYVCITVSDTGMGVPPEALAQVFEPFFTTKELGKGTGLGLATCYGIVKQHGGTIVMTSELGVGTHVAVYVPQIEAAPDQPRLAGGHTVGMGHETILVVEDEPALRMLIARTLQIHGYQVLSASNGEEALRVAAVNDIDLVVTDMMMPMMGGLELVYALEQHRRTMPVLLMSGYTEEQVDVPGVAFLSKPFSQATLMQRVREQLDTPLGVEYGA